MFDQSTNGVQGPLERRSKTGNRDAPNDDDAPMGGELTIGELSGLVMLPPDDAHDEALLRKPLSASEESELGNCECPMAMPMVSLLTLATL